MKDFLQELKAYLANTPREKLLEDWAKTKEFDLIGPSIEHFLANTLTFKISSAPPITANIKTQYSLEYSSGYVI